MSDNLFKAIQLPNQDANVWYKYGVYPVMGTQTASTKSWTGNLEVPELWDGLTIAYYLPYSTPSGNTSTLNLTLSDGTTTGALSVYTTGNTAITTHYAAGSTILLTYYSAGSISIAGTPTTAGTWRRADYSTTNTNTSYTLYHQKAQFYAYTILYRYQLLLQKNDSHLLPINTVSNTTATNKTLTTEEFDPFGVIRYYSATTTVQADALISAAYLYEQGILNLAYSFNTGSTLTIHKSVFIVADPQPNGMAKLSSEPISQTLPTSDDGKIYIYLGQAYSTSSIELFPVHPVYWFKNGKLQLYTGVNYCTDYDISLSKEQYAALGPEKYSDNKNYYVYDENESDDVTVIYGYHVDPEESDSSSTIIYLKDAVGMTPAAMGTTTFNYGSWQDAFFMPKPCMLKSDGTVDYYLNPNDYSKKVDGTTSDYNNLAYDGNCMLEWPLIFWKYEPGNIDGEGSFYCSNRKIDNTYNCWCNYDANDNITQHFYTAAFNGIIYDNKMRSIAGYPLIDKVSTAYSNTSTYTVGSQVFRNDRQYKCITAITVPEEFNEAKWEQVPFNGNTTGTIETTAALNNNSTEKQEWYIDVFADRMLINGLLTLISKSLNSQAVFGNGIQVTTQAIKNAYVTGALSNTGLFYGSKSSNTVGIKVFGIENWWGLVWHRTAGLIASGTGYKYKLTYGTKDGSTANGYTSTGTGYKTADVTRPVNGYLTEATYGDWGYLPNDTTNGSASTYYADSYFNGTGSALFGSNAYSTAGQPGCSCLQLGYSFNHALWSFATTLSCKPLAN